MASMALDKWSGERAARLDYLVSVHRFVQTHSNLSSTEGNQRSGVDQLSMSLVLRLAGEFQGFARDLHDEAAAVVIRNAKTWNPLGAKMLFEYLNTNRKLDRGNANPGALGADFGMFGFRLWPALEHQDTRNKQRQLHLAHLNNARNAIAHDDATKLDELARDGIAINQERFSQWRQALHELSAGLDALLGQHLAASFHVGLPW